MGSAYRYTVVVIGVSAGGFDALKQLLGAMPAHFPLPILIVQHLRPGSGGTLAAALQHYSPLRLKEADEGETLTGGTVYFAPADYHLLVERNRTLALSVDPPVRHARPSVDVLFESAADAFGSAVIGIVLTGANNDGSAGLVRIKGCGGVAIVQDPQEAEVDQMPTSALRSVTPDFVLPLSAIAQRLQELTATPSFRCERSTP